MNTVTPQPQRHAISTREYLRMGEAGVFADDARLELIDGEIVAMAPIGSPHAGAVNILNRAFVQLAGAQAVVSVQHPLIVGDRSVPQPDLALLKARADSYSRSHPTAGDVLLVVEVSDSTLSYDIGTKVPLYARAAVREAWVVDVNEQAIRVFRDPSANGYRISFTLSGTDQATCEALPAVSIAVASLFPV